MKMTVDQKRKALLDTLPHFYLTGDELEEATDEINNASDEELEALYTAAESNDMLDEPAD